MMFLDRRGLLVALAASLGALSSQARAATSGLTSSALKLGPAHGFDFAAAAVQVAYDITYIFIGRIYFDLHDRLEEDRIGFHETLFKANGCAGLESHVGGVDRVEASIYKGYTHIHNGIAGQDTLIQAFLESFSY